MCQPSTACCLPTQNRVALTSFRQRGVRFDNIVGKSVVILLFRLLCPPKWISKHSVRLRLFGGWLRRSPRSQLKMKGSEMSLERLKQDGYRAARLLRLMAMSRQG